MATDADLYAGYERWKNWTQLFQFDDDKAGYFAGELAGTAVAGARLLEIGFGSGDLLAWARARGADVVGTEVNDVLMAGAQEHGFATLPAAFEAEAASLAGQFDTIVAFDVFEHLDLSEIRSKLAACALMLKQGGHLVLRFPNSQSPFGLAPQNGDITHKSRLSRNAFQQILDFDVFSIVRYADAYRFGGNGAKRKLVRTLRGLSQRLIAATLNAVYGQDIPWGPVVVIVLRRL